MTSVLSRFPGVSLRARMTVFFTLSLAALLLPACLGFIAWSYSVAYHDLQERTKAAADLLQIERDGQDSVAHAISAFSEVAEDERLASVSLWVVDTEGNVIATNRPPATPPPDHADKRWVTATVSYGKRLAVAALDAQSTRDAVRQTALLLLAASVAVILAAGTLAWFFVGWTLRPIAALSEQARVATDRPLQVQLIPSSTDSEVRLLVQTLNKMLERLREDSLAREQFYVAAAHELRTPLAVLSTSIELTLSRTHTPEEYQETLAELFQQTRRLITLTESLLLLNRLEMRTEREESEAVDVADICERILTTLDSGIRKQHLNIKREISDLEPVIAPPAHILMLARNLLENAVRYATPGSEVAIILSDRDGTTCLDVYNECNLPDELELADLFRPFYRAEVSRSTATGGNGLGLAICKAIASANNWYLSLRRMPGGICATVSFGEMLK